MCLLIVKPANVEIPFSHLQNAADSNPHGAGVAIADGGKSPLIRKNHAWGADELAEELDKHKGHPALVHFRYATHGGTNLENTHPFKLENGWSAAHNGIISDVETLPGESDTRAFLRLHVDPWIKNGGTMERKDILEWIGKKVGGNNKLAFLHADGRHSIANEDSGHWRDGVWYSNTSYQETLWGRFSRASRSRFDPHEWTPHELKYLTCSECSRRITSGAFLTSACGDVLCEDCYSIKTEYYL